VATGAAAEAGVEELCRGTDLGLTELSSLHHTACHLAVLREKGSRQAAPPPA
jgi:hypothetical protein